MKGYALCELGKYDDAITYLNQAIAKNSTSADAYRCLGYCYSATDRIDDAISNLKKAIEINPIMKDRKNLRAWHLSILHRITG